MSRPTERSTVPKRACLSDTGRPLRSWRSQSKRAACAVSAAARAPWKCSSPWASELAEAPWVTVPAPVTARAEPAWCRSRSHALPFERWSWPRGERWGRSSRAPANAATHFRDSSVRPSSRRRWRMKPRRAAPLGGGDSRERRPRPGLLRGRRLRGTRRSQPCRRLNPAGCARAAARGGRGTEPVAPEPGLHGAAAAAP